MDLLGGGGEEEEGERGRREREDGGGACKETLYRHERVSRFGMKWSGVGAGRGGKGRGLTSKTTRSESRPA